MGSLILGLIFGFLFLAAFFFMPLLGVLFGAVVAGVIARGAGKGLLAGVGAGAIVGTVIHYLHAAGAGLGVPLGAWPKGVVILNPDPIALTVIPPFPAATYLGWVANYIPAGWATALSNWHWAIVVCAVLGAIGGLIGGAIRKE